ncbi:MAG: dinuclear metal center YbgI/SA1388 family protein [Flavobacteriales bacterium]|jgi:dinuclear metal center YbgI/SA1388 family protein
MMLAEIIKKLEHWAPPQLQESYDNSGLIVGKLSNKINGAIVCLDCIESVMDEAIAAGVNLIIAHHPIVFSGLKRFNGGDYIQRVVEKAIKNDINIYAIHTNLDNVSQGVNKKLADVLSIQQPKILAPKTSRYLKLVTFVPVKYVKQVESALFEAGAGQVGTYDQCSYQSQGVGGFRGGEDSKPFVGEKGIRSEEQEVRLEVLVPDFYKNKVTSALMKSHPYEVVAHDWIRLENQTEYGSGMIGQLEKPMTLGEFLGSVKINLKANGIRYTADTGKKIQTIAFCGGSGSFLLNDAKRQNADVFLTADYKYHQFFDADNDIIICDVGHFETEQYTIDLIVEFLNKNFPTFAARSTQKNTNPINYFN